MGSASVTGSLARVVERIDPAQALRLDPTNEVTAGSAAELLFRVSPVGDPGARAELLARRALLGDPTVIEAVTVLALQAQVRNDTERARDFFEYSMLLSRRELSPRIWAIEEAVDRGDIVSALDQYDFALRTSSEAQSLLLPNLVAALSEPRVREALLALLQDSPPWGTKLLTEAAVNGSDPIALLDFFRSAEVASLPVSRAMKAYLVNNLVSRGELDAAWNYYSEFNTRTSSETSRDPVFSLDVEVRSVFDWQPSEDPNISAHILQLDEGGIFSFHLPASRRGILIQQRQVLRPGRYRLLGYSRGVAQPELSRPYWLLTCDSGSKVAQIELGNSEDAQASFEGEFEILADCPHQTLFLIARSTDSIGGVSGEILRAEIESTN